MTQIFADFECASGARPICENYKQKALEKKRADGSNREFFFWSGENTIFAGGGTGQYDGKFNGLGITPMTEADLRAKLAGGYKTDTGIELLPLQQTDNIKFVTFLRIKIQP